MPDMQDKIDALTRRVEELETESIRRGDKLVRAASKIVDMRELAMAASGMLEASMKDPTLLIDASNRRLAEEVIRRVNVVAKREET